MYTLKIPPKQVTSLWHLREHAGCGSIAAQIRRAIESYIDSQKEEIEHIEKAIWQLEHGEIENDESF
ncbi:MAG: hypothetical protein Q8L47_05185 [bacterium]|nr:hypothetical protein [bacterium]